jgi:hypothetical protein
MNNNMWWLKTILSANSLAGLRGTLVLVVQRMGFKFFLLCSCLPQLDGWQEIRVENCPAAWLEYSSERKFAGTSDPMHRAALRETTPLLWRDWQGHYPDYFSAARKYGLVTGVTHPVHGPVGDRTSVSFIKGVGGFQAEREILAELPECQLVASYAHRAVARILESTDLSSAAAPQRRRPS